MKYTQSQFMIVRNPGFNVTKSDLTEDFSDTWILFVGFFLY